jgi:hypothetical protein
MPDLPGLLSRGFSQWNRGRGGGGWGPFGRGPGGPCGGGPAGGWRGLGFTNAAGGPAHTAAGPGYAAGPFPGAWPVEEARDDEETVHAASAAKFRAAEGVELELARKVEERQAVRDKTRSAQPEKKHGAAADSGEVLALDREIEALQRNVQRLQLEADEEYARELEREENKHGQ